MQGKKIVVSINAAWNIVNFRLGLIDALQRAGHEVVAVAPEDGWGGRLAERGIAFHPIAMDRKGLSPAADLALLWRYRRILGRLRADVFLGFTPKPNVWGSLAAQAAGMKVINNVSGLGTAFIRGGWLSTLLSRLYRTAFRRSATIFFQNPDDRALFLEKQLVRPEQARLLPGSGVDLTRFSPTPAEGAGGPFRFLLVGRIIRDKGVLEYVEAARRLRRRWPDTRFQLLGFLDDENRTAISADLVRQWADAGVIDYLGEAEDVRPLLAACDCAVLPSYREGLPRTLLEAAAMAKPLIATDVPGCRQVVREGVNGFLCAPSDPASLATAMERMLEARPSERAGWGAASRAIAEAEFGEAVVATRYLEAIEAAFV